MEEEDRMNNIKLLKDKINAIEVKIEDSKDILYFWIQGCNEAVIDRLKANIDYKKEKINILRYKFRYLEQNLY